VLAFATLAATVHVLSIKDKLYCLECNARASLLLDSLSNSVVGKGLLAQCEHEANYNGLLLDNANVFPFVAVPIGRYARLNAYGAATVRSEMVSRSSSAREANMRSTNLPVAVEVSKDSLQLISSTCSSIFSTKLSM